MPQVAASVAPARSATITSHVLDRIRTGIIAEPAPHLVQYGVAALAILAIAALRTALFSDFPALFLFTPAVVLIALYLGGGAGLLATVLSTASAAYALFDGEPGGRFSPVQWAITALFGATNLGLVGLVVALRRALLDTDASRAELSLSIVSAQQREAFLSGVLSSSTGCIKVLDLDGKLSFMSEGGQRVMEVSDFNAIAGCPWPDFWTGSGHAEAVLAINAAQAGKASSFIGRASTMKGTSKWWHVAVSPILGPDGRPDRILSVSRDITALRESEEERDRFVRLAENSTDFVAMAHVDGRVFYLNDAARRLVGLDEADITNLTSADFFPSSQLAKVEGEVLPAVDREGQWTGELTFQHFRTGEPIPVLYSVFPITDAEGNTFGYGTITRDFRARKQAEEDLRLMNGELAHRLKNVLAVVQSIAQQTLRSSPDMKTAGHDLSSRLVALGMAADVLTSTSWRSADLRELAVRVLSPHGQLGSRILLDGIGITLQPQVAVALALALHELSTNAAKYGALSNDEGQIMVTWRIHGDTPEARFQLTWQERGGPPVTPPTRQGFGSTLIERSLRSYFGGTAAIAYLREGLVFELDARLTDAVVMRKES